MKGDDFINIIIKFIGSGIGNYYQTKVKIYEKDILVFDGKTKNGYLKVCLKPNHVYYVKAGNYSNAIYTNVNYLELYPNCSNVNRRIITFHLSDYFYNLPIMKGEINLWQKTL